MSSEEPVRWKEAVDAPSGLGDLLRKARSIGPMPAGVRTSILATLPSAPPAAVTAAGAGTLGVAMAAGITAAASVAAVWLGTRSAATVAPSPARAAPIVTAAGSPEPAAESPSTVASTPLPTPPALPASLRPATGARPKPPARGDREPVESLAEESSLVARARASLAAEPTAALTIVDEHARRFPKGELASEREYLRIRALQALRRDAEARLRARSYLAAYPSSPQAPAVRDFLEGPKDGSR